MVRLFVPADSAFGCILAGAWTGLLAVLGKSRQGTFVRSIPAFTALEATFVLAEEYFVDGPVNDAVLKREGINKTPGKLWENNGQLTQDNFWLGGAALGMALAFNRRPFPGAMGWRRYVGMACIGGPLGTMSGQLYFESLQQERWFKATLLRQNAAHANYSTLERLARDDQFLASLPWLARRYLSHKLQKEERLMIQYSRSIPPEPQPPTVTSVTSAEQNSPSSTDMSGCEYDGFGRRIYVNSPDKFGVEQLQQYIQYVENARARITAELNYVREDLARREPEYFKLSEYTPEKEALHITLRHLSSWVLTLQMERSMAENIIVDASKQLAQLEQQQTGSETSWTPPKTDLPGTCHSPAMTANSLQRHWTRHRHQLSILEDVEKEGILKDDSIVEPLVTYAQFKRRVKAMERLLKDYEDKVAEAELNNSKQF